MTNAHGEGMLVRSSRRITSSILCVLSTLLPMSGIINHFLLHNIYTHITSVVVFSTCQFNVSNLLKLNKCAEIPYFQEVIVMASTCDACGYRNSEVGMFNFFLRRALVFVYLIFL